MTGARLTRELLFPLTDTTVLIAIVFLTLLTVIARQAGMLGLWLAVILVPALYRYLLMLLDARALGNTTPVAGVEAFNPADNLWSLTPLVLVALLIWASYLLHQQFSPLAAQVLIAAVIAILPASLAVLALTRSPWESLNPRAVLRMIVACGPAYALAPVSMLLGVFLIALLEFAGMPLFVQAAAGYYALFLLVTLTGALLHDNNVQFSISIPEPLSVAPAAGAS